MYMYFETAITFDSPLFVYTYMYTTKHWVGACPDANVCFVVERAGVGAYAGMPMQLPGLIKIGVGCPTTHGWLPRILRQCVVAAEGSKNMYMWYNVHVLADSPKPALKLRQINFLTWIKWLESTS